LDARSSQANKANQFFDDPLPEVMHRSHKTTVVFDECQVQEGLYYAIADFTSFIQGNKKRHKTMCLFKNSWAEI
jgi:hypothetical protein